MFKGLIELHFYIDKGTPMIYIKYFDNKLTEKTLRVKQSLIDDELGIDVTELAKRIITKYENDEGFQDIR